MRKRTKYITGASLFVLSLLTGIPGCVQRTGTLYSDTRLSLMGPKILVNGMSIWDGGPRRDLFSTFVGSFFTLRLVLFSWWWDTFCLPYDIYLKFDGVDFYVYDQDGQPIPDVTIKTYGEASFYGIEGKTDASGHLYYPRRVEGFTSLVATKDGYWGSCQGTLWLSQNINADLPQMLKPECRGHAIIIPTTNNMHSLNIYMKKASRKLPIVDGYHLVVSNVMAGVEYGVDLSIAELCAPFGAGKFADVKVRFVDEEITSHQRIRSSLTIRRGCSDVFCMRIDGCDEWPYLYYVPPPEAFEKDEASDGMKMPVLVKLPKQDADCQRYAIIETSGTNQYRQQGTPPCIYLRYWSVDVSDTGVLVCDRWNGKVNKVIVPVAVDSPNDTNLEPKR